MGKHNAEGLIRLVRKLESHISQSEERNNAVSKSDVAWQIDHSLKVINLVSESLLKSNPESYESRFNKWRFILFNLNYIPRGRAKSPKIVAPPEVISKEMLLSQVEEALKNIDLVKATENKSHFKHFLFGVLDRQRTIRFLHLHTNHHLKIIRDIIK